MPRKALIIGVKKTQEMVSGQDKHVDARKGLGHELKPNLDYIAHSKIEVNLNYKVSIKQTNITKQTNIKDKEILLGCE